VNPCYSITKAATETRSSVAYCFDVLLSCNAMSSSHLVAGRTKLRQIVETIVPRSSGRALQRNPGFGCAWTGGYENRLGLWLIAFGIPALAGLGIAGAAGPKAASSDAPLIFQIPAQSLATALQAYGQRAGVQVLYESESAAGRQSVAVEGEYASDRALKLLLSATDLEVHYIRPDAITLSPRNALGKDEPPADPLVKADLSIGELRVVAPSRAGSVAQDYSEERAARYPKRSA
jgi:Secretin and TonB N terminus short domain